VYGLGHCEQVVGEAVAGRREKVILATKCGQAWGKDGAIAPRLKAASVRGELEASLRRLRTEYIDLYQVHWPDPDADIEETWTEIAKAVEEGKIQYAGVSNFSVAQMARIQAIHPITSLQPPYSMLRRGIEQEILPFCAANGIGVVVYSPMQMGLLTGTFTKARAQSLLTDDIRGKNPFFAEPTLGRNLVLVENLRPLATRAGRTLAELSIAWVLRRPEVTAAIVGGRRPEQVAETIGAADWDLTPEEIVEVDGLIAAREAQG
jgi:aryl-alcohol dehydrogenase-like predicted oxidoreductase